MMRPATSDDAPDAVPLIFEAIGSIAYVLTGTEVLAEAMSILEGFFQEKGNRVSYENTLVIEESGVNAGDRRIIGVAISYDGSVARELDQPLEEAAKLQSGSSEYRIPTEAESCQSSAAGVSAEARCLHPRVHANAQEAELGAPKSSARAVDQWN
jgi:hypothetical protein